MISVIIRAKNEEELLKDCLDSVFLQNIDQELEVILVDSGSTDNTLSIARSFKSVRIFQIPSQMFTYSYALNYGFSRCLGEYVVSLSAHAVPLSTKWLEMLVHHFKDERVAGVTSKEIPWPNASLYEKIRLKSIFPEEGRQIGSDVIFSNAASMIRRSMWEKFPFKEYSYGEDGFWAKHVIKAGYYINYEPRAKVYHSHNDSFNQRSLREVKTIMARVQEFKPRFASMFFLKENMKYLYAQVKLGMIFKASVKEKLGYLGMLCAKFIWNTVNYI